MFFNRGEIFRSVPLAYPPLLYLLARAAWVGFRRRGRPLRPVWPVWVLAVATVFLLGFRIGLNVETPRGVIDVGYAGVIGASRILDGQAPYGHMPVRDDLEECGPEDADGDVRDRIQTNGRCESANERGDTYGPVVVPRLRAGDRDLRLERQVGLAPGGSRDLDRVRPAHRARPRARRASLRRRETRRGARLRLERLPVHRVHAQREHERRAHARVPRLGVLARDLTCGERHRRRARGLVEVRRAAPRAALGRVPDRAGPDSRPLRRGVRSRPRSSRSRCSCSSRACGRRWRRSGTGRSRSSSAATPRSRSGSGGSTTRRGSPISASSSRCSPSGQSCSRWSRASCRGSRAPCSSPR